MARFTLLLANNYAGARRKIGAIDEKLKFEQVVLEGINEIQRLQRKAAPVYKRGSIPRGIRPATVTKLEDGAKATSKTRGMEAIWTNFGTKPHTITSKFGNEYQHPGQRAQHWWEDSTVAGFIAAEDVFRRKIENVLGVR